MKTCKIIVLSICLILSVSGCSSEKKALDNAKPKTELIVSAAISLTDVLEEIRFVFEEAHNVKLTFNLGGSGKLATQIQQGAPVDVFISANMNYMDTLEDENLILSPTREVIAGNKIVLITGKSSDIYYKSLDEISADDINQIAIGNPESVPAGKYTEQILRNLDKWHELKSKIILAKDARQVLTYVETGNVDIGFVYESDALVSDKITVLATADTSLHNSILYPVAVLTSTKHEKEATSFVKFLNSHQAQAILTNNGLRK